MKKKLAFLLFPLLICGLTSCVLYNGQGKPNKSKAADSSAAPASSADPASSATPASSVTPPDPTHHDVPDDAQAGEKVTVYLVFGQYGKYENEFVNDVEGEPLYLEHVKKMTEMTVGSPLPGADKVTSSVKDSVFDTWVMYKNDGKLTKYSTVPAIKDAILYATFKGGSGGGSSGGGSGGGSGIGDIAGLGVTLGAMGGVINMTRDALNPIMGDAKKMGEGFGNAVSGNPGPAGTPDPNATLNPAPDAGAAATNAAMGAAVAGAAMGAAGVPGATGAPGAVNPAAVGVWNCPNCGKTGIDSRFCPDCGTPRVGQN